MNIIKKYSAALWMTITALCLGACSQEQMTSQTEKEGNILNLYIGSTTTESRLAELPGNDISKMFEEVDGKKDVGLYIYYQEDYDKGDLSKPYIRNLKCTNSGNKLVTTENIYIYDKMTIVAFYPYNSEMSKPENYFTTKNDEKAYPITESDYSAQTYIPYRAQSNVNPTNAYMIELHFSPRQTCKIEVLLVSSDDTKFPTSTDYKDGSQIKMVPSIDPYSQDAWDGTKTNPDQREQWLDAINVFNQTGGGQNVRRYVAYVWKSSELGDYGQTGSDGKAPHHDKYDHNNNNLKKGDILFESKQLTLLMPKDLNYAEETVYRYGYNLDTGEIFIPTSDRIVYDAQSLQDVSFNDYTACQVCDIDLTGKRWTPKTVFSGTFDGGGHAIKNLTINEAPSSNASSTEVDKQLFGFFGSLTGTSTLKNVNLVDPNITVDFSYSTTPKDTCYVGALCGLVNPGLSEAAKRAMILAGLPDGLSQVVKEALIKEGLKNFSATTCYVQGCKVQNPKITVSGNQVRVGGLIGGAGNQEQKADVKESYVSGTETSIKVNAANDDDKKAYTDVYTGAFCGLLEKGTISNSYSAITGIEGYEKTDVAGVIAGVDKAYGFTAVKGKPTISGCFSAMDNKTGVATSGVLNFASVWPLSWPLYTAGSVTNSFDNGVVSWPAYQWGNSWNDLGTSPSTYPSLIWEHQLIVEYK